MSLCLAVGTVQEEMSDDVVRHPHLDDRTIIVPKEFSPPARTNNPETKNTHTSSIHAVGPHGWGQWRCYRHCAIMQAGTTLARQMCGGQCLIHTSPHRIVVVFLPMPRKHHGARDEGGARRRLGSGETGAGLCVCGGGDTQRGIRSRAWWARA